MSSKPLQVNEASAAYLAQASAGGVPPGYKKTEVGVIPEDWEVTSIGACAETSSGATPSRALADRYYKNGSVAWVKTLDLNNSQIYFTDEYLTPVAVSEAHLKCYPIGTVVVAMYGGFNQIGRTGLLRVPASVNQALTAIRPDARRLLSEYLLAVLNFRVNDWKFVASSSRKDPNITGADIRRFQLALPQLVEQRAIAEALSDVDALIAALDKLTAKKRAIKQAAMQQLLTGKTRLPGFSGPWERKRLGEISDVDPENLPSNTNPEFRFNYISLEQVDAGRLLGYSEETFLTAPSRARRVPRRGDVLMSTVRPNLMAHLHYLAQIPNAVCSTGFAVLRAKAKLADPGFLYAHLFCFVVNKQIEKIIAGSNYPAINSGDVKAIEIPCPPTVEEQSAIAAVLADMDAEIAALEARRDKVKQIKQGMMQQLLTGRVRLV